MLVVDTENFFLVSGTGDVIEPDDDIMAIGSGGAYAQAAARALMYHTELSAGDICREAMKIAAGLCIYSNNEISLEEL